MVFNDTATDRPTYIVFGDVIVYSLYEQSEKALLFTCDTLLSVNTLPTPPLRKDLYIPNHYHPIILLLFALLFFYFLIILFLIKRI